MARHRVDYHESLEDNAAGKPERKLWAQCTCGAHLGIQLIDRDALRDQMLAMLKSVGQKHLQTHPAEEPA